MLHCLNRYIKNILHILTMEFGQILQKLKYSDRFSRSLIAKEIFANIQHVQKTELIDILKLLNSTSDMEFQVKLLSILSGCLLFNNTNRDVIIKWPSLYDKLSTILSRGLPMKTAVTLNFITSLLYTDDDDSESKSRTLTYYAQSMIRSSGCLTTMTHLFINSMTYVDTWNALCHCIAEVSRSSEINQTYCSHLVPLCIQRCLQGNLEVFPVLHSLLFNHKRNIILFLKTDGMVLLNKKEYLQNESCLQLLNTVIENTEVEQLPILTRQNKIHEHLQNVINLQNSDSRVSQWATITLYYLETKLKKSSTLSDQYVTNEINGLNVSKVQDKDEIFNDTRILFQNIMSEIRSYPPKPDVHKPGKQLYSYKDLDKRSNKNYFARNVNLTQSQCKATNLYHKKLNPKSFCNDQLSFSFLLNDNLRDDQFNITNINEKTSNEDMPVRNSTIYFKKGKQCAYNIHCDNKHKKQTDFNQINYSKQPNFRPLHNIEFRKPFDLSKLNGSKQSDYNQAYESTHKKKSDNTQLCDSNNKEQLDYNQLSNSFTIEDSHNDNVIEFKPAFVSTPIKQSCKKRTFSLHKNTSFKKSFTEGKNKLGVRNYTNLKAGRKRTQVSEKDTTKQKSMSSRLLEAINESCTTFIKSVKNVFTGSKICNQTKESINNHTVSSPNKESYCSYSFTKYMQKREAELNKQITKQSDKSEISTFSNTNTCETCNDTFLLKQKLAQDDQLKVTVKKLKLGINLYGCDFKKISKAMWPRETYMTPNVLYNLYRKLILK